MQQKILQIILAIGFTFICSRATAQAPSWTVSPSDFENSMTVTAVLSIEAALSDNPNDKVAAFVNGQIRGVASPDVDVPSTGQKVVFLQVYSNVSGGETVRFKIYQASSNRIIDAVNEIAFTNNGTIGSSTNPFVIGDNQAPTDLLISTTDISENAEVNSQVASFFGQDNDIGETFTYQLVNGAGDTDNGKFSIIGNGLVLQSTLDFETQASLEIRVRATDSKNGFIEKMFVLSVSDAADGPTDIILSDTNFDENRLIGTLVADLETVDQDENDSFTYLLVDDAGGAFSIQANQLLSEEVFNFEETSNYLLIIRTTDASGLSFDKTVNIAINDVNDAPSALLISNDKVNENLAVNSFVGLLSTEDEDVNESTTYSFVRGNNDNARFLIVGDSLKTFAIFNHEEKDTRLVQLRATDSGGATIEKFINIDINDVNDPITDIALEGNSIAENATDSLLIGNFSAVDEDGNDTYLYTMANGVGSEGNQAFLIDGNQLKSRANLNYEQQDTYSIRVQAIDQSGTGLEKTFTIEVKDANDPPTDIFLDQLFLDENLPSGTTVGTISTTDEDIEDEFSYELISNPGDAFAIENNQLKSNLVFNFEDTNRYPITIRSRDKEGESIDKDFVVNINDSNDAPTALNLSSTSIKENQPSGTFVGVLSTEDVDAIENHSYSFVSGNNDNLSFFIAGDSLKTFTIFNHEEKDTRIVEVRATDSGGATIEQVFNVDIIDDNDPITDIVLEGNSIVENSTDSLLIGTFSAFDEDENDTYLYTMVNGVGSEGNQAFLIDGNQLKSRANLNYELQDSYSIRIQAIDQSFTGLERTFTIEVKDANDPPTDISLDQLFLDENLPSGTTVGTISTTDEDIEDEFSYQLISNPGDAFTIQNNQLKSNLIFNFEEANRYPITIRSNDKEGESFDKAFVVTINDANDAPTALNLSSTSILENQPTSTLVGILSTEDVDSVENHRYSFVNGNNNNSSFFISGDSLKSFQIFNHEETPTLLVEISARDKGGIEITEAFIINVRDDNDASISFQLDRAQINENMPKGTEIGQFFTLDEDEEDNFTYSLVSGFGSTGNSAFRITENVLLSDSVFDYEQQRIFTIRVQVTDQSGDGPQQVFGILINDVNDAPTEIVVSNLTLAENNEEGAIIGTISTLDQDVVDSFFYDLAQGEGDEDNDDFLILDNQLVARKSFDYEQKNEYGIRLRTTDASEAVHEQQFTINILPVNEPPLILPNQAFEVFEDASEGELVGIVEVQDQDDQLFGFDLLSEEVPFAIDSLTGEIFVFSSGLDFETQQSYKLSIQAQDSGGLSHIETIFIQVLDVIESELPVNNFVSDNNDGKNDFFFIQNVDLYSGYSLFIFSGSGVLVYSQRDYQNGWYGQADNGKDLPEGVYYYKFTPSSEGRSFKGKVTLIR